MNIYKPLQRKECLHKSQLLYDSEEVKSVRLHLVCHMFALSGGRKVLMSAPLIVGYGEMKMTPLLCESEALFVVFARTISTISCQ